MDKSQKEKLLAAMGRKVAVDRHKEKIAAEQRRLEDEKNNLKLKAKETWPQAKACIGRALEKVNGTASSQGIELRYVIGARDISPAIAHDEIALIMNDVKTSASMRLVVNAFGKIVMTSVSHDARTELCSTVNDIDEKTVIEALVQFVDGAIKAPE